MGATFLKFHLFPESITCLYSALKLVIGSSFSSARHRKDFGCKFEGIDRRQKIGQGIQLVKGFCLVLDFCLSSPSLYFFFSLFPCLEMGMVDRMIGKYWGNGSVYNIVMHDV